MICLFFFFNRLPHQIGWKFHLCQSTNQFTTPSLGTDNQQTINTYLLNEWMIPSKIYVQFSSVTQFCLTLCNPMDCSTPGFPVLHHLPELAQTSIESVMPYNHLFLFCSLILLPSVFPSLKVFSNESALPIRWPKYWSFRFSISPSNEYSGLISFRMN